MRVLLYLTWATVLRFTRENRVVRSVVWPTFLGPVTVSLTLVFLAVYRTPTLAVAIPPGLDDAIVVQLEQKEWVVLVDDDPEQAVLDGLAPVATDGATVWSSTLMVNALALEEIVRDVRGSGWRMTPLVQVPPPDRIGIMAGHSLRPLGFLYMLYAMVFAMGSVARDRDASILDVERTLPVAEWVPGLARWMATVLVLSTAWGVTVLLMVVTMNCYQPVDHFMRGVGAIAAAAALGLALIGGAGLKQGFSAPFAAGTFLVAGLVSTGLAFWRLGFLPIVGLMNNHPGLTPMSIGLLLGPPAAWVYAWRVRRSS